MTREEYTQKHVAIEAECKRVMAELAREYVRGLEKFKIGDIITNGVITIKIQKYVIFNPRLTSNELPTFCYAGILLTKKLEPRKGGETARIYPDGAQLIKVVGK